MGASAEAERRPSAGEEQKPVRVLLVEDDPVLCETLQYNLQRERLQVLVANDAENALKLFHQHQPHLLILDVMLPGRSGFDLCQDYPPAQPDARAVPDGTGRGGGQDTRLRTWRRRLHRQAVQRGGADCPRALHPAPCAAERSAPSKIRRCRDRLRGEARLPRRARAVDDPERVCTAHLVGDSSRQSVHARPVVRPRVGIRPVYVNPRTVDVHIRWLRAKIEPDPKNPRYIQTVRGSGYRFEG
jgi:DNA-binding response OmpR family regulator